jgi:hypothetical protein
MSARAGFVAIAALALSGAVFVHAQQPAPAGFILGQLVDGDSGAPVAGATVTLGAPSANAPIAEFVDVGSGPANAAGRRVLTSSDGRFLFRDVLKGRYVLSATAPAYVTASFGQAQPNGPGTTVDLDAGERLGGVTMRIWKYGAISGVVTDDGGDPMVGAQLRCYKRVFAGGQVRYTQAALASTDDRGAFRMGSLVPGSYVCSNTLSLATLSQATIDLGQGADAGDADAARARRSISDSGSVINDANGFRVGDLSLHSVTAATTMLPSNPPGHFSVYPLVFYPSAVTPSQATPIKVASGEERRGVDLQLRLARGSNISGRVVGPNGAGGNLYLSIAPAGGTDLVSEGTATIGSTISDPNGRFTLLGIPPGAYNIRVRMYPHPVAPTVASTIDASSVALVERGLAAAAGSGAGPGRGGLPQPPPDDPTLWALVAITVQSADLGNVTIDLHTGARVTGKLAVAGAQPPTADQIQRVGIRLQGAEGRTSSPIPTDGRADATGAFRTSQYPPGRYIVSLITVPAPWSLKSATLNGKDVTSDPFELAEADIDGVVITLTDQKTTLTGAVTRNGAPDRDAAVVVFPSDSDTWRTSGPVARRSRLDRVPSSGKFSIADLPAGAYYVAAVSASSVGDWQDPQFLASLVGRASKVVLAEGGTTNVELRR